MNNKFPIYKTGIGQDSHRFEKNSKKPCILGGIIFEEESGFLAQSDGDVIFHSICNAISSISGEIILGKIATDLCIKDGITDSSIFVKKALETLKNETIIHLAISIEAKKPLILKKHEQLKTSIANVLKLNSDQIGITATSGEGLTECGCGEGVSCICIITTAQT
jgi:2-C-methyl-D-erythritol 2,4-cyclodiphosphate synthase